MINGFVDLDLHPLVPFLQLNLLVIELCYLVGIVQGRTSMCRSYGGRSNRMWWGSFNGWGAGSTASILPSFASRGLLALTRPADSGTRPSRWFSSCCSMKSSICIHWERSWMCGNGMVAWLNGKINVFFLNKLVIFGLKSQGHVLAIIFEVIVICCLWDLVCLFSSIFFIWFYYPGMLMCWQFATWHCGMVEVKVIFLFFFGISNLWFEMKVMCWITDW